MVTDYWYEDNKNSPVSITIYSFHVERLIEIIVNSYSNYSCLRTTLIVHFPKIFAAADLQTTIDKDIRGMVKITDYTINYEHIS